MTSAETEVEFDVDLDAQVPCETPRCIYPACWRLRAPCCRSIYMLCDPCFWRLYHMAADCFIQCEYCDAMFPPGSFYLTWRWMRL